MESLTRLFDSLGALYKKGQQDNSVQWLQSEKGIMLCITIGVCITIGLPGSLIPQIKQHRNRLTSSDLSP